jgi:hypothetical protein
MKTAYTGGCQCGNVRYEVFENDKPRQIFVCHCAECQRQSGSAFGMVMVIDESDLKITKGKLRTFSRKADSGREVLGAFCPECGTRIFHKLESRPGAVSLKPGTLDDTSFLEPQAHLWIKSKQKWVNIPEGVTAHEKQPSRLE